MLEKECKFYFDESYLNSFGELKEKLVSAPFIISPNWSKPFEVMCDFSGVVLGVVLVQISDTVLFPIYYASKTQKNYTMTKQVLLALDFAFEKFCSYFLSGDNVTS